ncbi:uncharacterized protein BJ212DRAFT_1386804 [Suillus subaureus]|uniref:Uncharacterized protein n=1 Tax=Suillus subaureus TaxID=48587 RepID=A0A9P7E0D6_9AGAM|nr:uncharacterized protein BJ212DRAFT_1386804 [Suillus subaureus]KAG1807457.1 hypothetical protein BJ212DRAFT_1386804 [Suillus subaureus]
MVSGQKDMATEIWCLAKDRHWNYPRMRKSLKGTSRLLRILVSESVHLIWAIRCDSTINGTIFTKR